MPLLCRVVVAAGLKGNPFPTLAIPTNPETKADAGNSGSTIAGGDSPNALGGETKRAEKRAEAEGATTPANAGEAATTAADATSKPPGNSVSMNE